MMNIMPPLQKAFIHYSEIHANYCNSPVLQAKIENV